MLNDIKNKMFNLFEIAYNNFIIIPRMYPNYNIFQGKINFGVSKMLFLTYKQAFAFITEQLMLSIRGITPRYTSPVTALRSKTNF
jgi:hypothetical protein